MQLAKKNLSFIKRFFFFHFQGKNKRGGLKKTHFPYEKPTFSTRFFYFIPLHVSKCFCITNGAAWLSGNLACTILWITAVFHRFLSPYISLAMFPSTQREKKQEKEKKKFFLCKRMNFPRWNSVLCTTVSLFSDSPFVQWIRAGFLFFSFSFWGRYTCIWTH